MFLPGSAISRRFCHHRLHQRITMSHGQSPVSGSGVPLNCTVASALFCFYFFQYKCSEPKGPPTLEVPSTNLLNFPSPLRQSPSQSVFVLFQGLAMRLEKTPTQVPVGLTALFSVHHLVRKATCASAVERSAAATSSSAPLKFVTACLLFVFLFE